MPVKSKVLPANKLKNFLCPFMSIEIKQFGSNRDMETINTYHTGSWVYMCGTRCSSKAPVLSRWPLCRAALTRLRHALREALRQGDVGELLWARRHHLVEADAVHGAVVLQTDLTLQTAHALLQPVGSNTITQQTRLKCIRSVDSNTFLNFTELVWCIVV